MLQNRMLPIRAIWERVRWYDDHLHTWLFQVHYLVMFCFVIATGVFHGKGHMQMAGAILVICALARQLGKGRLNKKLIPPELIFFSCWAFWCLIWGPFISAAPVVFWHHMKVLAQMVIMLWAATILFSYQRQAKGFYWAIICMVLINVVAIRMGYDIQTVGGERIQKDIAAMTSETNRVSGLAGNANGLAFLMLLGVWAVIMLWGEVHNVPRILKMVIAACLIGVCSYYIIHSASRKSLLVLGLMIFGWWTWVLPGRNKVIMVAIAICCMVVLPVLINYVMTDTYVGVRFQREMDAGGGSLVTGFKEQNIRFQFIIDGLKMWAHNPIAGVGFAQFSVLHWSGLYSHSDYIEPLACTGLVGFILYHGCAFSVFWRLVKLLRCRLPDNIRTQAKGMALGMVCNYYILGLGAPHWSNQVGFLVVLFCGVWAYRIRREYVYGRPPIGS